MSSVHEDEEIHHNKWVPRVITGGKGPPDTPGPPTINWLTKLPVGTTFTAQPRSSIAEKNLYTIEFHSESGDTTVLSWVLPDSKVLTMYFNPDGFCRMHYDPDILGYLPVAQQQEEHDDGNRPDRSADVVLHETVSRGDQLPED